MELYEEKARLRKELKKRRHNLNNDTRKEKSEQIAQRFYQIKEFKEASSVFCYLSYMDEVETTRLVKYILKKNLKLKHNLFLKTLFQKLLQLLDLIKEKDMTKS